MKTHIITKDQLDQDNNYIGSVDLHNFEGNLESKEDLGYVKFGRLRIQGDIYFKTGSGICVFHDIKADGDIRVGYGIVGGGDIRVGGDIETGHGITANYGIIVSGDIKAFYAINAGCAIKAGRGIETDSHITAGACITAGGDIKAGKGINAGLSIHAKSISSELRIFAGISSSSIPQKEDMEIRAKLIKGTIAHGKLVEPKITLPLDRLKYLAKELIDTIQNLDPSRNQK